MALIREIFAYRMMLALAKSGKHNPSLRERKTATTRAYLHYRMMNGGLNGVKPETLSPGN